MVDGNFSQGFKERSLPIHSSSSKKHFKGLISLQSGIFLKTFVHMNAHINNFIRFGLTFGRGSMAVLCSRCRGDVADEQEVTCVMSEGNGCSACVERAAIRDKIKRLEEEITKLKAKYHALGTAMNTIHDPFIHKLPPEIGSHIFYLYLPTFYPRQTFSARALKAFFRVLRLGAVCRKWRQLAWATPNLWETLSIVTSPERIRTRGRSCHGLV